MSKIVILFTGGTISMRHDSAAGGAVPTLRGPDILALVPGIADFAEIEVDDWAAHPGPHMTLPRMWELRARIIRHLERADVNGVVVTHGTDALEETAYLLARSIASEKPVVVTGAMRTSSDLGWDGPANLGGAVLVAANEASRGAGVLVVMSDRIFAAIDVTKSHTHALDAFESPGLGPLGVIDDGTVIYRRLLPALPAPLSPPSLAEPVDIVYAYSGADSRLLDASREQGKGIVIAAMGRGNVPPAMVPGIERWIADEKPVVITSRAMRGRVGYTYGYEGGGARLAGMGAIFAGARRPIQARMELVLGLGDGMSVAAIRELLQGD
jgi:L-asparaginase